MAKGGKLINSALLKKITFIGGKILLLLSLIAGLLLLAYHLLFWQRIYPGVVVAGIYLGGKTEKETQELFEKIVTPQTLVLVSKDKDFQLKTADISLYYDTKQSARAAFLVGRAGNFTEKWARKWRGLSNEIILPLVANYNQEKLTQFLEDSAEALLIPSIEPEIKIVKGKVEVSPGKTGQEVDVTLLSERVKETIGKGTNLFDVPVKVTTTKLTEEQAKELAIRAEKFIGKNISFFFEEETVVLKDNELVGYLVPGNTFDQEKIRVQVERLSGQFSRAVQNATFLFEGGRVLEFKPAKDGIEVEKAKLAEFFENALTKIEQESKKETVPIPVVRTKPKITTGEVNNLGIRELIGRGVSRFRGSIPSRIHNITLAGSRLNGILLAPGEILSFNQALGDVSEFTGYKQAYIIKEGKTILGDGGGVCQVSSTLFRAVLKAGLPIVERRAHSYRVSYYEQDALPGFDATVYSPSVDLKIKNDTPAHILIQAKADTKSGTLTFELYGTDDGRVAITTKPRVWDQVAPPPDSYQDDPTLPAGKIKQVDFKAWGAKAAIDYKVTRGNEVLQDRTFYSVYRPWQAVYLRGIAQ